MNRRHWLQTASFLPLWMVTRTYADEGAGEGDDRPESPPGLPPPEVVVAGLSALRQHPRAHADLLRTWLPLFEGNVLRLPGAPGRITREGRTAVEEAIAVLGSCPPLGPHIVHPGLRAAAQDHATEQGRSGTFGHAGTDGSSPLSRMRRYVPVAGLTAENITYGPESALDIVLQLAVDDGVPARGHRCNLLHPSLTFVGVGVARQPTGRVVCVVDYAERVSVTSTSQVPPPAPATATPRR